ncbi:hypothetical protein IE53DRAFT_217308 [Violaceomyces palustris]|uniref:Uncharacterized protein n=1 Tax=Violaceomyces palustris TaxID=1673888 RepID=A0ACD0NQJ4_9BASI|nr:hypothetical protein IE53DRAFT_217308 [Violaceomyces palustris]
MGLALMTLTSMNRKNPRFLRSALLSALRQRMGGPEGLALSRTSSVSSIQTFLLLSLSPDIGSDLTNSSGSQSWLFVGQAIRMAFDIGLHRAMSARSVPASRLNRRSRVWAACIVLDRWYALYHGQPYTISLEDCDAPGPSPFDDDDEEGGWQNRSKRPYTAHVEMTKLAILIGRVLKTVYLPSGLKYVRREDLLQVEAEIDSWSNSRPISLRFDPDHRNSLEAGVLHALHACIEISFYRVFFPSKSKPPGPDVGFRLDRDRWHSLVQRSASALTWLNDRGEQLLDIWFGTVYAVILRLLPWSKRFGATSTGQGLPLALVGGASASGHGGGARGGAGAGREGGKEQAKFFSPTTRESALIEPHDVQKGGRRGDGEEEEKEGPRGEGQGQRSGLSPGCNG